MRNPPIDLVRNSVKPNRENRGRTGQIIFNIEIFAICNEILKCKNLFEYREPIWFHFLTAQMLKNI